MGFHGGFAEDQVAGNFCVGAALGHEVEHFHFAIGQVVERCRWRDVDAFGERLDQTSGDAWGYHCVAGCDDAYCIDQLFGWCVFQQEAAGPGSQRRVHVLIEIEGGEHEDARRVGGCGDASGCFNAAELGHADVHQHDIGMGTGDDLHRLDAISGFTDDSDVVFGFEDHPEPGADEVLVVDHHDTDHGVTGSVARTNQPPPCRGPASSRPPQRAARSRMPVRP